MQDGHVLYHVHNEVVLQKPQDYSTFHRYQWYTRDRHLYVVRMLYGTLLLLIRIMLSIRAFSQLSSSCFPWLWDLLD